MINHLVCVTTAQYSDHEYEVKEDYAEYLKERRELFRQATSTKKTLRLTLIAAAGVKKGKYSSVLQSILSAEDLFVQQWLPPIRG